MYIQTNHSPKTERTEERQIELLISDSHHLKRGGGKQPQRKKKALSCYGMTLSRGWLSYVGQNGSGGGGNGRRRKGRISSKTLSSMPASCWTRSVVVSWPSLKRIWNIISRASIRMQPKIYHSAHQVMCHAQFPQGPHSIPPNPGCVRLERS